MRRTQASMAVSSLLIDLVITLLVFCSALSVCSKSYISFWLELVCGVMLLFYRDEVVELICSPRKSTINRK